MDWKFLRSDSCGSSTQQVRVKHRDSDNGNDGVLGAILGVALIPIVLVALWVVIVFNSITIGMEISASLVDETDAREELRKP